ncbi:hypothetical protein [Mycobacterium palustre]|nr:hypothetical protein [Mycobacterium palustre]
MSETEVHQRSMIRHRNAAAEDRQLAEQKRTESDADLTSGDDH